MSLTLDDISGMPTDTDSLVEHLTNRGLLQRPVPPPAPEPVQLQPMQPPANTEPPATPSPVATMKPPSIEGTAPTAPSTIDGIAPTQLPKLSMRQQLALPQTSPGADIGSSAYTRNQLERDAAKKADPWGSADNHPGFLGKLGHIAARAGNIAGDILVPNVMANIPGTDLNNNIRTAGLKNELAQRTAAEGQEKNRESEESLRDLQKQEATGRLSKEQTEQNLEKDAEGNVTGWKDGKGVLHSLEDPETPQAIKEIAEVGTAKPHFEKTENGDIVQITPGKNGQAAQSDVVYKGNPKQKVEIRPIVGPDGHAHDQVIDVTQGSPTFGQSLKDLGRSKEDKQPSIANELAKEKAGERVVLAYDKDNHAHLMSKADADAEGLEHITAASPADIDKAKTHHVVLNTLQTQLNNVAQSRKALDQNLVQRGIIATSLSHPTNGALDSAIRLAALSGATEDTKNYVQSVIALREAGLALPKEITGGSRVAEIQASALWAGMPSASSLDSNYAIKQAKKFQQDIDRLRERAPEVRGMANTDPDESLRGEKEKQHQQGGGGGTHKVGDVIIQNEHRFKVTAVDKSGKPTGADPL